MSHRDWHVVPDGVRRGGITCDKGRMCLINGESAPHSHYVWAKDISWAHYGDLMSATSC